MPKAVPKKSTKQKATNRSKGTRATCGLCTQPRATCACSQPGPTLSSFRPQPLPRGTAIAQVAEAAARAALSAAEASPPSSHGPNDENAGTSADLFQRPSTPTERLPLMLATAARQAGSEPGIDAVAPMAGIEKGGQAEAEHEQLDQENEEQGDGDEDHEEAEGNDEDDEDEELGHNEKACRELWLSTEDALAHVKTKVKWEYVEDDKKRHRVIREKYWRLVKQASIFANRTGVHVLLAAGRTERSLRGLKEHVFASEELCKPSNKCLNNTANVMADSWTKGMAAYRELLITRHKEQDALLRQHQAQFLADQQRIKEKDEALQASLANAAALQEELDRL